MGFGSIGSVLDTLEYSTTPGSAKNPHIINISGDVYVVVWQDTANDGHIATFTIDSAGTISNSLIDELEFDTADARIPRIVSVGGGFYAIAYHDGTNSKLKIVTIGITDAGAIDAAVTETYTHTVEGQLVRIINISGEVYAVTYQDNDNANNGAVFTINIDSSGDIGAAVIDSLNWDTVAGTQGMDIVNVSGTMYAIAYTKDSDRAGGLVTFAIAANGTIDNAVTDTYEFEAVIADDPSIVSVSGVHFAIAFGDTAGKGQMVTVQIATNGTITAAITSTLEFDSSDGDTPHLINISGTLFALVYKGVAADGFIKTLTISTAGIIGVVTDTLEFDESSCGFYPKMIVVSGGVIAVAYIQGAGGPGFVKTAKISLVSEGRGGFAVVEDRWHYVGASGIEYYIQGTPV